MRRKRSADHENHERWLVSYADLVTLLFAFFVVMFASSQRDTDKAKQIEDSVREAIGKGGLDTFRELMVSTRKFPNKPVANSKDKTAPFASDLKPSLSYLTTELKDEISSGKLQVSLQQRGLVVSLREASFFASGDAMIYENSYATFQKIAVVFGGLSNPIRFEGHTDAIPINNARYRSNWELSAARSIAVMELFHKRFGMSSNRFAIAGYAENLPLESNDSAEGRARNRRVDIVILSNASMLEGGAGDNGQAAPSRPSPTVPATPMAAQAGRPIAGLN